MRREVAALAALGIGVEDEAALVEPGLELSKRLLVAYLAHAGPHLLAPGAEHSAIGGLYHGAFCGAAMHADCAGRRYSRRSRSQSIAAVMKDPYLILGVRRTASADELK